MRGFVNAQAEIQEREVRFWKAELDKSCAEMKTWIDKFAVVSKAA